MDKLFIKSEDLLKDSFQLAWNVYKSGFEPNYIVGVWRGGAPIGIQSCLKGTNTLLQWFLLPELNVQ